MATRKTAISHGSKHAHIVKSLRGRILNNELTPGSRCPTRTELTEQFDVSPMTAQRALDALKNDGFVYTNGRQGTYISPHPPHLCRYGMVFPHSQQSRPWSLFWTTLQQCANAIQSPRRTITFYYENTPDTPENDRLLEDARNHRMAGMLFIYPPANLLETPAIQEAGIARVAISNSRFTSLPTLTFCNESFHSQAMDHLRARGCRRLGIVAMMGFQQQESIPALARSKGLEVRPYWVQEFHNDYTLAARNCVHAMMRCPAEDRPDGLIIADDNLVTDASAGLIASGVKVGQDVEVVAHCNFPNAIRTPLPVRYLGFDCAAVIEKCMEIIDSQRQGRRVPLVTRQDAQFEVPSPAERSLK